MIVRMSNSTLNRFCTALLVIVFVMLSQGCSTDVRFATFNASLTRDKQGQLATDMGDPKHEQIQKVAQIIQTVRPDVLLINEFDYDSTGNSAALFQRNFLSVSQGGQKPIEYRFTYVVPSNTGIATEVDMDGNGKVVTTPGEAGYAADAHGWGEFPGRYAFVMFSQYPIDRDDIRTLQTLKWGELPENRMPDTYYGAAQRGVMRLSSKNHVDVPIRVRGKTIHVIAAHPTPPVFDGPEDRNGLRNFDEIKLLKNMIERTTFVDSDGGPTWTQGKPDVSVRREPFVVMGDLNADPNDGESVEGAINQLLNHPLIDTTFVPTSTGGEEAAREQGGVSQNHKTPAASDTADWRDDRGSGNLRVDYVLPSKGLRIKGGGVFWPEKADPNAKLIDASDHRLVWLDVRL
jgi:Endonuclease/Exonuclease/phosphatase family